VRGWLRRFRAGAEANRSFFTALAHSLDPLLGPLAPSRSVLATRWRPSPPPPGPPSPASVPGRPGPSPRSPALEGCCPTPVAAGRALIERRTSGSSSSSPGGKVSERHRDVALFRYSVIREAADASLTKAERGALVRAMARREHLRPDGERVAVSRNKDVVCGFQCHAWGPVSGASIWRALLTPQPPWRCVFWRFPAVLMSLEAPSSRRCRTVLRQHVAIARYRHCGGRS
jgi:hypothetical protein